MSVGCNDAFPVTRNFLKLFRVSDLTRNKVKQTEIQLRPPQICWLRKIKQPLRPRPDVELFMRRTKLSKLSSSKVRRVAELSSSE